jgi:hypothetical protein
MERIAASQDYRRIRIIDYADYVKSDYAKIENSNHRVLPNSP